MKNDGTLAEITEKWFDEDISTVPDTFTPIGSDDDSLDKIKEKGEFILGLDSKFPPMGYEDDDGEIISTILTLQRKYASGWALSSSSSLLFGRRT